VLASHCRNTITDVACEDWLVDEPEVIRAPSRLLPGDHGATRQGDALCQVRNAALAHAFVLST
jgi:hypothetical protein